MRFDRYRSSFGGPRRPAPSGRYALVATLDGLPLPAVCSDSLAESLPLCHFEPEMSFRVGFRVSGEFLLNVQPPLKEGEQGRTRQKALRQAYASADVTPTDSVLFQCYRGEFATDSQLALDEALRAARPDLVRYWGVRDLSTEIPEGSLPVVIGTQEWYHVLAASRYLCNNIDFDGFFRKRPHQRYLQTFHGYPFKSMGTSFWAGKGFAPDRILRECQRRNADWDAILVPSEECADFYRTEYAYRGDVLVTGYPRADFVVNADRPHVRRHVLQRLGIPEDKTVVLYAPTYRDDLTTRTYAAERFDELDLVELTDGLGPEVVIMLRGHNNNQRELDRVVSVPNVVDVTDYPEINELTVAADAAILDYSSLRFEWALTGRPALFFVPDVDSYFARRPPCSTTPGPHPARGSPRLLRWSTASGSRPGGKALSHGDHRVQRTVQEAARRQGDGACHRSFLQLRCGSLQRLVPGMGQAVQVSTKDPRMRSSIPGRLRRSLRALRHPEERGAVHTSIPACASGSTSSRRGRRVARGAPEQRLLSLQVAELSDLLTSLIGAAARGPEEFDQALAAYVEEVR